MMVTCAYNNLLCYYVIIQKTTSPRKTEKNVRIKFGKTQQGQKQLFADVVQNRCSENFYKFHRKKPVLEFLLNKVAGLKVCNFIKIRPQYRCFPMNFPKFLRISFFTERLLSLLLQGVCKGTSLVKILQSCHFNMFGINHRCFRKMAIKKNNE